MIRILTISINPSRVATMRKLHPDLEVFWGVEGCTLDNYRTVCIPKTYHRLERHAVKEGLGRETIITQDDVWMPHGPGLEDFNASYDTPLLIYGRTEANGDVAPHAWSAAPEIHLELRKVWDGKARIVPAWQPLVKKYGLVLDVTGLLQAEPSVFGVGQTRD